MNIRTDLALEAKEFVDIDFSSGVVINEKNYSNMKITEIIVKTDDGARKLGKDKGTYITAEFPNLSEIFSQTDERIEKIGKYIRKLLPEEGTILVVGLGNLNITPDSLGPKCSNKILATRHIKGEIAKQTGLDKLRSVAVISPGVLGQTGIETSELVLSVVEKIKPSAIIAIDALASRKLSRLGCTLQISDTGISPGAGVNNKRFAINKKTVGIPVIALGIPTVVDALTLACDIMPDYVFKENIKNEIYPNGQKMVVTPREIDLLIERGAQLISLAINCALHENFNISELISLIN